MRKATVKLITFAGGRNMYLTTLRDAGLFELAVEIRDTYCPQVSLWDIKTAIMNAVWEDNVINWFADHKFGVEVVSISDLKPKQQVQKTDYAYNR